MNDRDFDIKLVNMSSGIVGIIISIPMINNEPDFRAEDLTISVPGLELIEGPKGALLQTILGNHTSHAIFKFKKLKSYNSKFDIQFGIIKPGSQQEIEKFKWDVEN